jgi:large conductance mechanosensitive channel
MPLEVHGSWRIVYTFHRTREKPAAGVDHNRQMIPTGEQNVKRRAGIDPRIRALLFSGGVPHASDGEMAAMLKGFLAFLNRGNVIDLAVAVVIGGAFGAVVTALVKDLITPLIAAIFGKPNFGGLALIVNHSHFLYGDFLNSLISFVCIAGAVYYLVVVPTQKYADWRRGGPAPEPPALVACPECLSEIPAAAHRCKFCTAVIA